MLYKVKSIALAVPYQKAYNYLADKTKLPEWANAFATVEADGTALMRTPAGEVPVKLKDTVDEKFGIIDTLMIFPDGSTGIAMSRLMPLDENSCVYSFTLTPPPVELEKLEGALEQQAGILEEELKKLKSVLEG